MAVYITGDTHSDIDIVKIRRKDFEATEGDYVIICGDFGVVWDNSPADDKLKEWYDSRPWTTLFVDGNHENHDLLDKYPVENWHGGKVHKISDKTIHLMRGQVFEIEGKTFFTMGGASSTDKAYRREGVSWWARELPSKWEMEEGINNLNKIGKVDYVLTHCAPTSLQHLIAYWYEEDYLNSYLNNISLNYKFNHWYIGHYHIDTDIENYTFLYNKVIKLE